MRFNFILFLFVGVFISKAQDTSQVFVVSGYLEPFYTYDFNTPKNNQRSTFLYNHNRHNEFNINLGFMKMAFAQKNIRSNIALAIGTYMNDNYSNETGSLKNILEANVGIQIKKDLWFDVGVLPSHIGFESAISKDCWTLTRSLIAENSPYFETGGRLTFSPNDKWLFSALVLNGWQRIGRVNNTPSLGSQVLWHLNNKVTFNWSTFYGNDKPDTSKQMRFFNNFYGIFSLSPKLSMILGVDIGSEKSLNNGPNNIWYGYSLISKYTLNEQWAIAGRYEKYKDLKGIITANNFNVSSMSVNLDYNASKNALWRLEGKFFKSDNNLFPKNTYWTSDGFSITSSIAVSF